MKAATEVGRFVYTVKRDNADVTVQDHNGNAMYKAALDSWVIFGKDTLVAKQVSTLDDQQLLLALLNLTRLDTSLFWSE
jgi:hypothetical protein